MIREPILYEFDSYLYGQGREVIESEPAVFPLFEGEALEAMLAELREILRKDREELRPELLQGPVADGIRKYAGDWFQRIDFPEYGISTTSDRTWGYFDEGGVNTLGRHLTSEEACLLRPWPKWTYVRHHLGDLRGKTVMEIGSCNGFFPFRFAEMGALKATGVEVLPHRVEMANWAKSVLGLSNVEFIHADIMVDYTIPQHDVVFVSEVLNHLLCPLWGLTRLVALAKELLILDTGAFETPHHCLELSKGMSLDGQSLRFFSFDISDGLLCGYLRLLGIRSDEIVKYVETGAGHILYRIDTRGVHERRAKGDIPYGMEQALRVELKLPETGATGPASDHS